MSHTSTFCCACLDDSFGEFIAAGLMTAQDVRQTGHGMAYPIQALTSQMWQGPSTPAAAGAAIYHATSNMNHHRKPGGKSLST